MADVSKAQIRWPAGSGEMAHRIRSFGWAATPLGPIDSWQPRLRTAVDIMLATPTPASVMWGPDRIQLYNDAYIPIAEGRHPDALGRSAAVNWAEAHDEFLGPLLDEAFAGKPVIVDEQPVALIGPEGAMVEHIFTATFSPIRDESGAVAGVFHPLVEVTEQARAQAILIDTSRRLDAILNNTREAVFLMDDRQHCIYANAAAEQLTGYSFAEMQGRPLHDVVHHKKPDGSHYPLEECPIDRAFPERAQMSGEELFVHKDGSFYPVAYTASPLLNEAGEPIGTVIEARNIAEEKARDAALRELNERLEERVQEALAERKVFADVVDSSSAAVTALDLEFNVLAINSANVDAFERVFGRRPQVGDNLIGLLEGLPQSQAQLRAYWSRALAGEEYILVEEFGEIERRSYEVRFSTLRDVAGRQIGAASTAYDVTERVRAEARLAEAEEALRQAQKMEAIGSLTGGVAHDFNNLLTPIIGSLDMLQRKGTPDQREQRLVAGALEAAEKAKTLVQRLLAFARRQPLQPKPVDLAKLAKGMAEIISSTIGPQIQVVVDAGDDLPPAQADANQLEMALLNLSVNARDAMPRGGTLRISASAEAIGEDHRSKLPPGRYILLSVADTGAGMDEATLKRAVEPFFSTKGVGKGTGLGLSMVHGLAAQLGGALSIQSRPDLGTNVELWLPQSTGLPRSRELSRAAAGKPSLRGTALLVEDEDLVRASTKVMLDDLGYAVKEAASAEEALRLVEEGLSIDLLVTDHLMQGKTGTELAHELRGRLPHLPVMIVSGFADLDDVAPDLPRLSKPFRQAELSAKLDELLSAYAGPEAR